MRCIGQRYGGGILLGLEAKLGSWLDCSSGFDEFILQSFDGLQKSICQAVLRRESVYLSIYPLVIGWDIAGRVLDLVGQARNAGQTVIGCVRPFSSH